MVKAMVMELEARKDYLKAPVETVYFGGGTPSVLSEEDLRLIMETIHQHFQLVENPEITLESNPDDITWQKLHSWKSLQVNRLSMGVQSFDAGQLQYMNRAHNSQEAAHSLTLIKEAGFDNYNADLIYGIPHRGKMSWEESVDKLLRFSPSHISAYALTIEKGTAFGHWESKGKLKPVDEELMAEQYHYLVSKLKEKGFQHYEVSNFALPDMYSRHNTSYWQGKPYLGIGPSAHSFDGSSRSYNVANNVKYIKGVFLGESVSTTEILGNEEKWLEYLMISLRTEWGIKKHKVNTFKSQAWETMLPILQEWQQYDLGRLNSQEDAFQLNDAGMLLADGLIEKIIG